MFNFAIEHVVYRISTIFLYIFRVVYKDDNDSERLHFCTIVGASTPASGGSLKVSILQLFFTSTKKK